MTNKALPMTKDLVDRSRVGPPLTPEEHLARYKARVAVVKQVWLDDPRRLGAGTIVNAMFIVAPLTRLRGREDFSERYGGNAVEIFVTRERASERMRALREELDRRLPGAPSED